MIELDPAAHERLPWRLHAVARDFDLEDVWRLPMSGGPGDFDRCVEVFAGLDPVAGGPRAVRALFALRLLMGRLVREDGGDRAAERNAELAGRLPQDLRDTDPPTLLGGAAFGGVAVTPLFRTADEWAVAIASGPVDGILHVGWPADTHGHRAQLAVLVRRRGLVGRAYMAAIEPARRLVVYPLLGRELERRWRAWAPGPVQQGAS